MRTEGRDRFNYEKTVLARVHFIGSTCGSGFNGRRSAKDGMKESQQNSVFEYWLAAYELRLLQIATTGSAVAKPEPECGMAAPGEMHPE